MKNKLIQAGNSRLKKAADATIDPAVPAELQTRATAVPSLESAASETSVFAGGRVLEADDVQGTPEEQLAFVTERLIEIDGLGRRAEDFIVLNKGALLEVAQQRELHKVAGFNNFAQWAGGVLDVEEKYVFELLQDAARIRTVGALGSDLAQHLTKASARKVVSEVITDHGLEVARVVMEEGLAEAAKLGKKRPTAAMLSQAARVLTAASIPSQGKGSENSDLAQESEISDPSTAAAGVAPEVTALERGVGSLRERVYAPLAPAAVKLAVAADAEAALVHLDRMSAELQRISKRLAAAQRAASVEVQVSPAGPE